MKNMFSKKFERILVVEKHNYWNLMMILEAMDLSTPEIRCGEDHDEITVVCTREEYERLLRADRTSIMMKHEVLFKVKEEL